MNHLLRPRFGSLLPLVAALGCEGEIGTPADLVEADASVTDASIDVAPDVGPCAPCSVWQVRCGSQCVDLTVNPEHCGACNVRCDGRSQWCRSGVCASVAGRCVSVVASRDAGVDASVSTDAGARDQGLRGEYYATANLRTLRQVRVDPTVDFDWTMVTPPVPVSRETFSARWSGTVRPRFTERYTFITSTDDGVRLWIDDQLLIDDWTTHAATERTGTIELRGSRPYSLRLEYFNGAGAGSTRLSWTSPSQMREVVPASALTPGTGVDSGCDDGVCCLAGGTSPVCCPSTTRCVMNDRFAGCCPLDEPCGELPLCSAPR